MNLCYLVNSSGVSRILKRGGGQLLKNETTIFWTLFGKSISRLRAQVTHSFLPKNYHPKGGAIAQIVKKIQKGKGPPPNSHSSKYATG